MIPFFTFDKITLGPITIYIWGLFLVLAFLLSYFLLLNRAKKQGINTQLIDGLSFWALLGIIIGSRINYVLQFPSYFSAHFLEIFAFWQGGLTLYGGFLGGLIFIIIYLRFSKIKGQKNFWPLADLIALYLPLSLAIGRLGCFLINDHQGALTSLAWGIIWPDGAIRHPVALYLIINALIIFLILKILEKKLKKEGQIFFSFLLLFSFSRFFWDFTRSIDTTLSDPQFMGLFTAQWISLIIFFVSVVFWTKLFQKNKQKLDKKT